jgi:hypothetical protein
MLEYGEHGEIGSQSCSHCHGDTAGGLASRQHQMHLILSKTVSETSIVVPITDIVKDFASLVDAEEQAFAIQYRVIKLRRE